jgi:hypothetical protein
LGHDNCGRTTKNAYCRIYSPCAALLSPVLQCLSILENALRELFLKSFALRDYLNNVSESGMCDIRVLCGKLDLEVNDVPLLMSVASTHSPDVMRMYGLSFK